MSTPPTAPGADIEAVPAGTDAGGGEPVRGDYEEFRAAVGRVMRSAGVAEAVRAAGFTGVDVHAEPAVWDSAGRVRRAMADSVQGRRP